MTMPEIQATEGASAEPKPQRRVRNFLLDTGLQLRLAVYLLAVATALSAGLGLLLWRAYRETTQVLELADPRVGALAAEGDRLRILVLGGALVVVLLCLLGAAIMVTHRIAGPAFALGAACRRVAEGHLDEPRPLRQRDLLTDLAEDVGAMIRALRGREEAERQVLAAAAAVLRDGAAAPERRGAAAQSLEGLVVEKERRLRP